VIAGRVAIFGSVQVAYRPNEDRRNAADCTQRSPGHKGNRVQGRDETLLASVLAVWAQGDVWVVRQLPGGALTMSTLMPAEPSPGLRAILHQHESRIRSLGDEEAVVLAEDGKILLVKQGAGLSLRFTDTEIEQMRGAAIFTHNHPGGRAFSPEDLALACALGFGELRVVTDEWTHVLRPGSTDWTPQVWAERLSDAVEKAVMAVDGELRQLVERRKLPIKEANADFWHCVWERVAEAEGLEYDRYTGERTDAD
jgi:hypothetical protein